MAVKQDWGSQDESSASSAKTKEWLTPNEGAAYLKVQPNTLRYWLRTGKIKGYKLSGTQRVVWRLLREDLDAHLLGQ